MIALPRSVTTTAAVLGLAVVPAHTLSAPAAERGPVPRVQDAGIVFSLERTPPTMGRSEPTVAVTVTFSRRADPLLRRMRGKHLDLSCKELTPRRPSGGWGDEGSSSINGAMPARGRVFPGSVAFDADAPPALCRLTWDRVGRRDVQLAEVAMTPTGVAYRDERDTALTVVAVLSLPPDADEDSDRAPAPEVLVRRFKGLVAAVDGPGAPVPAGKVGYWSDSAFHLWIGKATRDGRVMFVESKDDVLTSNMAAYLFDEAPLEW